MRKLKRGFSKAPKKKGRDIAKAETPAKPTHTQKTLQEGQEDKFATNVFSKKIASKRSRGSQKKGQSLVSVESAHDRTKNGKKQN